MIYYFNPVELPLLDVTVAGGFFEQALEQKLGMPLGSGRPHWILTGDHTVTPQN